MKPVEFGDYTLLKKLATGGMGEVFLARQEQGAGFERFVAIKRILPELSDDDDFVRMFLDEARLAAKLSHPNVVQIYDLGICGDQYYLAMEFLEGRDLRRIMGRLGTQRRALAGAHAVQIIYGAAEGLHYAHQLKDAYGKPLNIIHRDVSPQNIFVSFHGTIKVLDFGIAKAEARSVRTRTGGLKGKYPYLSPEQVRGDAVDARSDVFSLGTVLWEVTVGRRLFKRDNDLLTLKAVMQCEIPRPSELMNRYPKELEAIVMKSLARDPDRRYESCRAMQEDLEQFVGQYGLVLSPQKLGSFVEDLFPEEPKTVTDLLEQIKQKPQTKSLLRDEETSRSFPGEVSSSSRRDELTEPSGSLGQELVLDARSAKEDSVSRSVVKGGEARQPMAATAVAASGGGDLGAEGLIDMFPGVDASSFGDSVNLSVESSASSAEAAPAPRPRYVPPTPLFPARGNEPPAGDGFTNTPSRSDPGLLQPALPPEAAAIARAPTALHGVAAATPAEDDAPPEVDLDIDAVLDRTTGAPAEPPPSLADDEPSEDDAEAATASDPPHDTAAPEASDDLTAGAPETSGAPGAAALTAEADVSSSVADATPAPQGAAPPLDEPGALPRRRTNLPIVIVLLVLAALSVPAVSLLYTAIAESSGEGEGHAAGSGVGADVAALDPTGPAAPPTGSVTGNHDASAIPAPAMTGPDASAASAPPTTEPDAGAESASPTTGPDASAPAPPAPEARLAKLVITTSPEGLTVRLGDRPLGTAPVVAEVPPGAHRINVRSSRGIDYTVNVEVAPGETLREQVAVPRGSLAFRIRPYANVFIDGRSVGLTPMPPVSLHAGRHRVRLVNDALHRSVIRSVTVRPGQRTTLSVDMASAP